MKLSSWTKEEYHNELGCYIKWIHGSSDQSFPKIFCMSAFHLFTAETSTYNKYAEYMLLSIESIIENSDWAVRLYIDESLFNAENKILDVWQTNLDKLVELERVQILVIRMPQYIINEKHIGLLPVIFRYLALFDETTMAMCFRDIDNVWTEQHTYFIAQWLNTDTDLMFFMNQDYSRQEVISIDQNGPILNNKHYTCILSGMWSVRKPQGFKFSSLIWQQMFAYNELYTDFVNDPEYESLPDYKNRFMYGFDELMLSRVMLPALLDFGLTVYAIPIKIWDVATISNLIDPPIVRKLLLSLCPTGLPIIKQIIKDNYWHMSSPNAGLSQYLICFITNLYFQLIVKKPRKFTETFLATLRDRIYPVPILMGLGLFTFHNYNRYIWYPKKNTNQLNGSDLLDKFLTDYEPLSIENLTFNSDLSNSGDGSETPNTYNI